MVVACLQTSPLLACVLTRRSRTKHLVHTRIDPLVVCRSIWTGEQRRRRENPGAISGGSETVYQGGTPEETTPLC